MTHENTNDQIDEVSIFDVFAIIYRNKKIVFLTMFLCLVLAVLWVFARTVVYTSTSTLVPAENQSTTNQSLPSIGGGAFGQLLGGGSPVAVSEVDKNIALLNSRNFLFDFLNENGIPALLEEGGHIKVKDNTQEEIIWEAYDYFMKEIFLVSVDDEKGIITVSVTWVDPVAAATWVNLIISKFNSKAKAKANAESNSTIEYLDKILSETRVNERRTILLNLIEQETRNLTMSNVNNEYAFSVIDSAISPVKPSSVRAILVLIGTFVFSLIFGIILSLFYHQWSEIKKMRIST